MADDVTGKGLGGRLPSRISEHFQTLRSEMDRLFDNFLTGMPPLTPSFTGFHQAFPAAQGLTPAWDVKETEKEFVVTADLPGIDEKDIELTIRDGVLRLRGEKKSEKTSVGSNYHVMERSHGSFHRSIRLPASIDEDKIAARFDRGVLTITVPKRPEAVKEQKKIEIKGA